MEMCDANWSHDSLFYAGSRAVLNISRVYYA